MTQTRHLSAGSMGLVCAAPGGSFGNDWSVLPATSGDGPVRVSVDVANVTGTYDGLLIVDGQAAATTSVEVGAGSTRRAVFTRPPRTQVRRAE